MTKNFEARNIRQGQGQQEGIEIGSVFNLAGVLQLAWGGDP